MPSYLFVGTMRPFIPEFFTQRTQTSVRKVDSNTILSNISSSFPTFVKITDIFSLSLRLNKDKILAGMLL